jgi:hypothetical protein
MEQRAVREQGKISDKRFTRKPIGKRFPKSVPAVGGRHADRKPLFTAPARLWRWGAHS